MRLTGAEVSAAASFLGQTPDEFSRLYLRPGAPPRDILPGRSGYCLFHQPDGRCLIHPVKPAVCRLWPFLPALLNRESAFQEAKAACPGLRADLAWAEFRAAGAETKNPAEAEKP